LRGGQKVKVKVTWKAFGNKVEQGRFVSSVEFDIYDTNPSHEVLLNAIYKATNLKSELADFGANAFEIYLWKVIEALTSSSFQANMVSARFILFKKR